MTHLTETRPRATAQAIARVGVATDRPITASLGIALHHFTEPLIAAGTVGLLDAHRATTILTKQVRTMIEREQSMEAISHLVTDPIRFAMLDGRTAAELCGPSWNSVVDTARARSALACDGVSMYGPECVMNLAIIRATQDDFPWWGSSTWNALAADWFSRYRFAPRLLSALQRRPERVDDSIICDILSARSVGPITSCGASHRVDATGTG